jgi:GNAT superfamily N-acetyltransferase
VTEIRVRAASTEDVSLILSFIKELAEYERLSHEVVATEDSLLGWLFGERPVAEVLIGEHGGEAAAFALFFHNFSTFLGKLSVYLEDIYVRPEFRGRGIGKAMLAHLARLAKERGCGRLEWSVLDWNEPSINFYESVGAVAMSDWTVYRMTGEALDGVAGVRPDDSG